MKEDVVPEVPGKQPKGYFKGVEKDKKAARDRQFKRQAKMHSNWSNRMEFSYANFSPDIIKGWVK